MAESLTRRASDNGILGRILAYAEMFNKIGISIIISSAVVVLIIGWMIGWWPTPWVSLQRFEQFNNVYEQVHRDQLLIHTEQLGEMRKQTKILHMNRCDNMDTMSERKTCYHEIGP